MQQFTHVAGYCFVGLAAFVCLINVFLFIRERLHPARPVPSGLTGLSIIFSGIALFLGELSRGKVLIVFLLLLLDPQNWFMLGAIRSNFFNKK